jgi:site-specific DNA-methyltransferase (adenine-specific)
MMHQNNSNVSKEYDDDLSLKECLNLLKCAFSETYRFLINGWRAYINVANLGRKPYIPLSDYISKMMMGSDILRQVYHIERCDFSITLYMGNLAE